jgi:glycosyltransferase involved in cell wall biosynthesis
MSLYQPLVSVLMTAYNREKYIAEAVESILASSYTNFELIIVDDCSSDNTVSIAKSFEAKDSRVRVFINDKNLGDYPNRNKAASYASGKYIKYLDSDDIMYPHCLDIMVSSMEQFPDAAFGLSSIGDPQTPYPVCITPEQAYKEHFAGYAHFDRAPGSSIILKRCFDQVGGFNGQRMIGDNEFWFRLGRQFPMVKFQRDLIWDRIHSDQESKSKYALEYNKLRTIVLNQALSHSACPLTKQEIRSIYIKMKLRSFKNSVKNGIRI